MVMETEAIREVVRTVPEVVGCEKIRSRGWADHVFVDLHLWMSPAMRLDEAHRVSHVVKDRIMERYPQVKDVVIHLEPPPTDGRRESGS